MCAGRRGIAWTRKGMRLEEARRKARRQEGMETSKRMRTGIMRSRHE